MRLLSRFLVHTSARFLEDEYSISYTTILRIDKEVLENDIPKPKMQNLFKAVFSEIRLNWNENMLDFRYKVPELQPKA